MHLFTPVPAWDSPTPENPRTWPMIPSRPVLATLSAMAFAAMAYPHGGDLAGDAREAGKHGWIMSFQDGLEQARKLRKPMMLVFRCVP